MPPGYSRKPPSKKRFIIGLLLIGIFIGSFFLSYKLGTIGFVVLCIAIFIVFFPLFKKFGIEMPREGDIPLNNEHVHWTTGQNANQGKNEKSPNQDK